MTETLAEPALHIQGVSRTFGRIKALDNVDISIGEGEFFALLGPSGCGKTTLLRTLAGFEWPDAGAVKLGGLDLLPVPPNKRPINLMFQSYALFPHLSVAKNVAYGLQRERLPAQHIRQRVEQVLDTVGLADAADRRPHQLSGGQRQRVALARSIVKRPKVLLLDEPLSALDRKVRAEMQLELKRLQHEVGITFVLVTHDQEEAMSMADRIAVLAGGRVQQVATPVELYRNPANEFIADFIGTSNRFSGRVVDDDGNPAVAVDGLGALAGRADHKGLSLGVLVIRPEEIRLVGPGLGRLRATVEDAQFVGGVTRLALRINGAETRLLATVPGFSDLRRGDNTDVTWDPTNCVIVPAGCR